MKESLKNRTEGMATPEKNGRDQHLAHCIAAEQCPYCGEDIFDSEEISENNFSKTFFYQCSACPWRSY